MNTCHTEHPDLHPGPTGVLVMRVWIEAEHPTALRARIIQSSDGQALESPEHDWNVSSAATTDDALRLVRSWLEAFAAR